MEEEDGGNIGDFEINDDLFEEPQVLEQDPFIYSEPTRFEDFRPQVVPLDASSPMVDLQVIDIHTYASISKGVSGQIKRVIVLYCKRKGSDQIYKICTEEYHPYVCLLPLENHVSIEEIQENFSPESESSIVLAYPVYPFVERPCKFLKYIFHQPADARRFAEDLLRGPIGLISGKTVNCKPYNCLNYIEQFQQETGISGFGWIRIPQSHCREGILKFPVNVVKGDDSIAPLRLMTIDIECAKTKGLPTFGINEIIVIACVCTEYKNGTEITRKRKVVFQYGSAIPLSKEHIDPEKGDRHLCFKTEQEMLNSFGELVDAFNPDFLAGHNFTNFDLPYLVQRAHFIGCSPYAQFLGRTRPYKWFDPRIDRRESKGGRATVTTTTETPGRIQIDTYPWIQAIKQHRSYKLGALGSIYLGATKMDVPYQMIKPLWQGSDETRARLATYCLWDTILTQGLIDHKDFQMVLTAVEMSRTTRVPANKLLRSGMQAKVFGVIYEKAMRPGFDKENYPAFFPYEHPKTRDKDDKYAGAVVLEPFRGYYPLPVACADFRSLYPSVMVTGNFCWSTVDLGTPRRKDSIPSPNKVWFVNPATVRVGIIPQLQTELFAARDKAKAQMKEAASRGDTGAYNLYNTRQNQIKLLMNSTYGILGASGGRCTREELAIAVTSSGREKLRRAKEIAEAPPFSAEVIYGDSVTGDTPVLYRVVGKKIMYCEISYDFRLGWVPYGPQGKEQVETVGLEVWSDLGWTAVRRIIRHKTKKHIYRVRTKSGCVDVTADHSLITFDGALIKPSNLKPGMRLLHSDLPPMGSDRKLLEESLTYPAKLSCAVIYNMLQPGDKIGLSEKQKIIVVKEGKTDDKYTYVCAVTDMGPCPPDSYVYDLETENHHFSAGIGRLVVHNTDSIFVSFPGVEDVEAAFKSLVSLCKVVTDSFAPSVIVLQPEKVMYPIEMVGKKKYIFNMYEGSAKAKPKLSYKGVELARRDNCGLVIDCMTEVVDYLMLRNSPKLAKEALDKTLQEILLGKVDINKLVVSKTITKDDYKIDPIHVIVSKKMFQRDPSYDLTGPGEKVPFVIVRKDGKTLGDKAEDPLYAITHGYQIDSEYYIQNQLAGPMSRVFMFVDMDPGEKKWLRGMELKIREAEFQHEVDEEKIAGLVKDRKSLIEALRKRKEHDLFGMGALQKFSRKITAGGRGIGAFFKPVGPVIDLEDTAKQAEILKKRCDACRGIPSEELSCAARDCPVLLARATLMKKLQQK
jgi:DNA polymerase elongation subunit (family B)